MILGGDTLKININDINIMAKYKTTSPAQSKIEKKMRYYKRTGAFKKPIILNSQNYLVDGYIWYLMALQLGLNEVDATYTIETPILFGKHPGREKEYCWRIPNKIHNLQVGDLVYCRTCKGIAPVVVTRFGTEVDNVVGELKSVIRKGNCDEKRRYLKESE